MCGYLAAWPVLGCVADAQDADLLTNHAIDRDVLCAGVHKFTRVCLSAESATKAHRFEGHGAVEDFLSETGGSGRTVATDSVCHVAQVGEGTLAPEHFHR